MSDAPAESTKESLNRLLEKIYRHGGYDFRDYKDGTIIRRLERRLHATEAQDYNDYMRFLNNHPEEYENLARSLTITVSSFLRNPDTFEQIGKQVIPKLISRNTSARNYSLRFWSAACAHGEEPYSIAMTLAGILKKRIKDFRIKIYATDINRQALEQARSGLYPPDNIAKLPDSSIRRYFTSNEKGLKVRGFIRKMVNFSYFDLVSNAKPQFKDLDCIFCCNILIYLQRQLQEKLLANLYEMLAPEGYLILGEVESPTDNLDTKLRCLDTKAKIYQKV